MVATASKIGGTKGRTVPKPRKDPDTDRYSGRIAANLRGLRDMHGLTVPELAAKITRAGYKVSAPTLYAWENGNIQVQTDALPAIARAFRLTVREFLPEK